MMLAIVRATGLLKLLLGISFCFSATSNAQTDLPVLPLSMQDGVPYIEGVKIGMSTSHVKNILTTAGYSPVIRSGVITGYKKGETSIHISRNPNVPVNNIKYQTKVNFDLQNQQLNYQQKKKYIDMFNSLFPNEATCRLTKNMNAHTFCKYQVMHLGKLRYRMVLEIVNMTVQLKYTGG
jgi:hypothetical protein